MALQSYDVESMCGPTDVARLIYALRRAEATGAIDLNLGDTRQVYPNGAVPMAVAVDFYRRRGLRVSARSISESVKRIRFLDPVQATTANLGTHSLKNIVWRYSTDQEAYALCNAFVDELQDNARCESGVLDALNWCISEVLDNVLQHSKSEAGFVMMQLHYKKPRCAIAISDDGIGIHRSFLENNVHGVRNAYEAIMKSVQEGVTSKSKNMGNGLYGLMRVVGLNSGELEIRSGRGWMTYKSGQISGDARQSWPVLDAENNHGTTVDWQLDLSTEVSIVEALGMKGMPPLIERLEDEGGEHRVLVSEFEEGLGTRRSAEQIRTRLENYLTQGVPRLVLDFSDVNVVSSSFADEVLGKLALRMGLVDFTNSFRLDNMTATVKAIIDRALRQRIAEGDDTHPGAAIG